MSYSLNRKNKKHVRSRRRNAEGSNQNRKLKKLGEDNKNSIVKSRRRQSNRGCLNYRDKRRLDKKKRKIRENN